MGLDVMLDILIIVKLLGGGFFVGVMLIIIDIVVYFKFGIYGSIYGGNLLVCVVVECMFDIINDLVVLEGVKYKEQFFCDILVIINDKYKVFSEICGKGMLLGCVLIEDFVGQLCVFLDVLIQ